jgi:hypothetical protein
MERLARGRVRAFEHEVTRETAMAAFAKSWRRENTVTFLSMERRNLR